MFIAKSLLTLYVHMHTHKSSKIKKLSIKMTFKVIAYSLGSVIFADESLK